MKKRLNIICLWIVFSSLVASFSYAEQHVQAADATKPQVDVGVLAIRGHFYAEQRWLPTLHWLNTQIPDVHFVLHPLDLNGMTDAVENRTMDFVLTNPGQAVRLGRQYALSWIATLTSRTPERANAGIGSALIVRSDSPYTTLQELVGLPIAAVSEHAFGGYLTMRHEVMAQGLDPNDFFADVRFLGFPIDVNLYQLREHNVEAAVVPVCLMEEMVQEGLLEPGQFRVINQLDAPQINCAVSTPLYPNWSFAKTERGKDELAKKISRALLAMPADSPAAIAAKASGWTSPTSLLAIDKLYQAMDLHPLQQPWWKEAIRWLRAHQAWAWTLFVFVIVLNGYHFWLEYRFSKSKSALQNTLLLLKEKSEMLEHSQRIAIVGELGSSLAHEINQPLAAIRNYSEGGLLRLSKNRSSEDIVLVLEKIQAQVDRADAIVNRLRTLIKRRSTAISQCDVESLISDTLELLHFRSNKLGIEIVRSQEGQHQRVDVDPVGIQQALVNILNNAIDACQLYASQHPNGFVGKVAVHTDYQTHKLSIRIIDNGTGLKHSNPTQAFVSTKQEGLGLGLAICRDVLEMHNGNMTIQSISPHGCAVELSLPYQQTGKQ